MFDCTGLDKTVEGLAGCLTKKLKERLAEKGTSQLQTKTLKRTTETKQIVGRPKRYNALNSGKREHSEWFSAALTCYTPLP